jgi:hypothetical protein
MPMYVVRVDSVLMMGIVRFFAMVVVMGFVVVIATGVRTLILKKFWNWLAPAELGRKSRLFLLTRLTRFSTNSSGERSTVVR